MKKNVLLAALVCGFLASATPVEQNALVNENVKVLNAEFTIVSPLCLSISKNDIKTVKKLISLGENVNKFSKGMSPLMYAARYNRVEIIKLLVSNGANVKAKDSNGNTALVHAKRSGANEAATLLMELRKKKRK